MPASAPKMTDARARSNAPVGVAGVGEGPGRDLEREQLHRLDGGQRRAAGCRRRAGRTRSGGRKPPHFDGVLRPASVGDGVGVVVAVGVPALGRHLGDGVGAGEQMLAQNSSTSAAPGKIAGHADDGDVERRGRAVAARGPTPARRRRLGEAARWRPSLTSACRSAMVVDLVAQRRDLADHVHALAALARPRRRATSRSPSRARPLLAMRSRPRLSVSSAAHIALASAPAASSRPCACRRRRAT